MPPACHRFLLLLVVAGVSYLSDPDTVRKAQFCYKHLVPHKQLPTETYRLFEPILVLKQSVRNGSEHLVCLSARSLLGINAVFQPLRLSILCSCWGMLPTWRHTTMCLNSVSAGALQLYLILILRRLRVVSPSTPCMYHQEYSTKHSRARMLSSIAR